MRGDAFIHFVCGCRRVNIRLGVLLLILKSPQVTGSKVWTIGRVRKCLDAHLGQIVCDKDGVVHCPGGNTTERFEECWPIP